MSYMLQPELPLYETATYGKTDRFSVITSNISDHLDAIVEDVANNIAHSAGVPQQYLLLPEDMYPNADDFLGIPIRRTTQFSTSDTFSTGYQYDSLTFDDSGWRASTC